MSRQEFKHALFCHIRTDAPEEGGGERDVRDKELRKLLEQTTTEEIVLFMEAHDTAALLSVCVQVRISTATGVPTLNGDAPLVVHETHNAHTFLQTLRATEAGKEYYLRIAKLLLWALGESELQPYLPKPLRHASVREEPEPQETAHE